MELLVQIMEVCIIPLLGILTKYIVSYINAKRKELNASIDSKYINMIADTISKCVVATNQTYVDSLKNSGSFDAKAQKKAFEQTYENVIAILSDDAKKYIEETTGDLKTYLTALIEASVNQNKGSN